MAGGFLCPWCRGYNASDERVCGRCGRRLPSSGVSAVLRSFFGVELLATKALLVANIFIYALQTADMMSQSGPAAFFSSLERMNISTLLRFGALTNGLEIAEPFRLLSACFVHMSLLHIIFNMMALVQLGRVGEEALGTARFLITYVFSGILGFAASGAWYLWGEQGRPYITAGASGAVFGITGLVIAGLAVRRDPRWKEVLVQQLVYSFIMYYALKTNQAAHLGGLVVGIGLGVVFWLEARPWKLAWAANTLAALSTLAILASLALPHRSSIWRSAREAERIREERRRFQEPQIVPLPPG